MKRTNQPQKTISNEDFLIGHKAIAREFPFGWHAYLKRVPELRRIGIILGPRIFGKPPGRVSRVYSKKSIINRFLIENPNY